MLASLSQLLTASIPNPRDITVTFDEEPEAIIERLFIGFKEVRRSGQEPPFSVTQNADFSRFSAVSLGIDQHIVTNLLGTR